MFQLEAGVLNTSFVIIYFISSNDQMAYMILLISLMLMTFITSLSYGTFSPTWIGVLEIWFDYATRYGLITLNRKIWYDLKITK